MLGGVVWEGVVEGNFWRFRMVWGFESCVFVALVTFAVILALVRGIVWNRYTWGVFRCFQLAAAQVVGVGGPWDLHGLQIDLPPGRYCDLSSLQTQKGWMETSPCPRLPDTGMLVSG